MDSLDWNKQIELALGQHSLAQQTEGKTVGLFTFKASI